jgi:flagellum-specific ATP synthase
MPTPRLREFIANRASHLSQAPLSVREGRLKRVSGLVLEVEGLPLPIGAHACLQNTKQKAWIDAECIGFNDDITYLMPFDPVGGMSPGAAVCPLHMPHLSDQGYRLRGGVQTMPINHQLLGRVVDGLGRPLDGKGGAQWVEEFWRPRAPNPLRRLPVSDRLETGIKAIDGLLTVGRGQRMGLFAGSGVGKSVLLSMLARNCRADVIVVGLVGERSREVREFCDLHLDVDTQKRAVVIAAPADTSPLSRLKGAEYATDVATWFRDQGHHVVLILDSLTRFAMAQREIGLSLGEAPVTRGYPPSVFAKIPALVERVGNGESADGSLTAFYTVLLEADDVNDPIGDAARGVLDGHIFLSREIADTGHYPAIDIERSISRVMPNIVSKDQILLARRLKQLHGRYLRSRDLISMGAYAPGQDPELDLSIRLWPKIQEFLRQESADRVDSSHSLEQMSAICAAGGVT